ncbi:DUF2254 domain-containing protein [Leptolyngbya sp. AN02str]|uniref:DUF2254 domain-containing protein n=1 Tax=Leptolyngbya sp. AN02str TaxID=3423363 RepID=UPI003D31A16E
MKNIKLAKLWDSLRSSYWFLPSLMALGGMLLAFGALTLDHTDQLKAEDMNWIYRGGAEGARGLLSAIAGSMVTVAATAFSITIVALQLAASNFGPRLLRNFMQDTGNQVVLGTFIATFLYCLLVLPTVRGEDYGQFIPKFSVTIAIGLAIASTGVLIYFIHHASTIIQASHVIADVADDLERAIERLFPEEIGRGKPQHQWQAEEIPQDFDASAYSVQSQETGYLQVVDDHALLKAACKHDLLLRLQVKPGKFVSKGNTLMQLYPETRVNQKLIDKIHRTFLIGKERTEQQDISFPIEQLVEIAVRALSPGINDPSTAIRCIDRLGTALSSLAKREFPSPYRFDNENNLRVIAEPVAFEQLVDIAFTQIQHYGQSDVRIIIGLLNAIEQIASCTHRPHDRFVLQQQAETVMQLSYERLSLEKDREKVAGHYHQVMLAFKQ